MKLSTRAMVVLAGAALAVLGAGSAAVADTSGPSINFFKSAIPVVGTQLSNSSATPNITIKDGWTIYDPDGISSASVTFRDYTTGVYQTVWSMTGSQTTTKLTGKYQFSMGLNDDVYFYATARDWLGNVTSQYAWPWAQLAQEGAASYGPGWSTSAGAIWSGGAVMKSSTVGKKATYTTDGRMVSLVSDKASNRGSVSIYVDGVFKKTVSCYSSNAVNRVIVWNSPYFTGSGSHVITLKVASGRIDIDAFVTTY